mgnify:CR=1 FL=1
MYFKTFRISDTGKKFKKVEEKASKAFEDQKLLADELGFKSWREGYWQAFGGISCVHFDNEPDAKLWKKNLDGYLPKLNTKAGKELQKKFDDLTSVSYDELNKCVGFDGAPFKHIGVNFNHKNFYGFAVGDDWDFKVPEDCEEITLTEYKYLFKSK